ncbi:MAG: rod shape-determining protein MreC [Lachnospiraceae bacterium]|nr:rod shape-determining protein MreC [Lachnospiraceae bacterium]
MSPVVKQKKEKFTLSGKYLLLIFSVISLILMVLTYGTSAFDKPLNTAVGYVVVPFETGISRLGSWLSNRSDEFTDVKDLLAENEALKQEIARLTEENSILAQDKYELTELRILFELSDTYNEYNKVGAHIIAKDSGNWYSAFIIDKGTDDGLAEDMNVIAGGGLVGRISSVGPNWARVTTIISDGNYVSAMMLATNDTLMVEGSLELMDSGIIKFAQLKDNDNVVVEGDKVVTSKISDKYLPNILIGYIQYVSGDSNNLTKSGYITPAVDFSDLSEVLVITDMKNVDYK